MSMADDTRSRADEHNERPRHEAGGRDADPLAELARLIGQSDPFAELKRKPTERQAGSDDAPPGWLARAPASAYDAYQAVEPAFDARRPADTSEYPAADRTGQPPDAADVRYEPSDYDERYRVAMPSAEGHSDYYGDEMPDDGAVPPPRRPGWLIPVVAVLGLAVVGTAGAFGYRALTGPSTPAAAPPVIKADTTPAKVAPAVQPGEAQPKIFDRVGETPASERVVSREEQPVDVTRPRLVPPPPTMGAPPTVPSPNTAPAASVPPANANEPKRVRTTVIRPVPADPAQPNAGLGAPTAPTARTPLANPPARTAPTKSGPLALNPQSAEAPAQPVRTVRAAPADGTYVVQVSAQKTESDAQSSYRALQAKYPNVLGGREASIRRADLGDKGVYYRAQVGPFATANQATTFCDNLKAAGGQCIVQRN